MTTELMDSLHFALCEQLLNVSGASLVHRLQKKHVKCVKENVVQLLSVANSVQ